jgi:hypothetical protein
MLAGVLERSQPPKTESPDDTEPTPVETSKGRGVGSAPKASRTPVAKTAKRVKGRTVYMPDDLFERILVQAHRRDLTISDYCCLLLDRHVPDHRSIRAGQTSEDQDAA